MTLEELRVHRTIMGILVRNYVNTQRLDVQVIGSAVYVEGELQIFEYYSGQRKKDPTERDLDTVRLLLHLEKQIRSLAEVSHLEFKLRNWDRSGLQWIRKHTY